MFIYQNTFIFKMEKGIKVSGPCPQWLNLLLLRVWQKKDNDESLQRRHRFLLTLLYKIAFYAVETDLFACVKLYRREKSSGS